MKKVIIYGSLAALFFSSTFAINHWLNIEQSGHWYWTASLRYFYVFLFLTVITLIFKGLNHYKAILKCFLKFWHFWILSGGVGFGLFYLLLCYAASYSPGWVLATTWQTTILATPIVMFFFGKKMSLKSILYLILIFIGILLVNINEFQKLSLIDLNSILPIVGAAFCYPIGNTLCKYATEGEFSKIKMNDYPISKDILSQILLMTMGALPILITTWFIFTPPSPTSSQIKFVGLVALLTGVIATGLLYKARQLAQKNNFALIAADGTQAAEVPLALFWEYTIFGAIFPSITGIMGIVLVSLGIFLFYKTNIKT